MKKYLALPLIFLLFAILASGCALTGYGKLQVVGKTEVMTVETLKENWQNYEVYYAGVHAAHPSAVMFERKDDDGVIVTDRWFKVKNKEMLDELIYYIQTELPYAGYYPRLWRINGPEGDLYGFMFTSWDHAVMKMVGEKTLLVHDIPMPPYLAIDKKGFDADVRSR